MNRGVLQSSPVQQMMAAGNPDWWSINNMIRPSTLQHTSFSAPLPNLLPQYTPPPLSSTSWAVHQELPESIAWSQPFLGGLDGGNHNNQKCELSSLQTNNALENWEEHSTKSYMYGSKCEKYQMAAKPSWSPMMPVSSPPTSCLTTLNSNNLVGFSSGSKSDRRRPPSDRSAEWNRTGASGGVTKKARVQTSPQSALKVRKEKLGDRITALHQLVSPFGKTDTASVLLEAIGYIRFLQNQIEALSLPYLGHTSGKMRQQHQPQNGSCEEPKKDLSSRGLSLVPISCMLQVGNDNGADYWAPALGGGGGFR